MAWWILAAMGASLVSTMVLGMLWYGPLFGQPWLKAMGWGDLSEAEMKEKQAQAMPGYLTSMASAVAATGLVWMVLVSWDALEQLDALAGLAAGALFGVVGWAAFYVPGTITARFFEDQTWTLWAIGAGYWGVLATLWGLYVGLFGTL